MASLQLNVPRSPWKTSGPASAWNGSRPNPWGLRTPALVGLGSKAAPDLDGDATPVDRDWAELEEFASTVEQENE